MSRLLVMTWFWQQEGGRAQFKPEHVNIWAAMMRRHCTLDIELACVTHLPEGIDPSIRIITPPSFYDGLTTSRWKDGRPSCYRRLSMFSPDAAELFGAERFASMDLDVVIGGNIDSILDRAEDFVMCGPSSKGRRWIYNGSLVMMNAGARRCVYDDFSPEMAEIASRKFVGSDQAWIAYALGPGEAIWTEDHGVTRWNGKRSGPMMFFPGHIKPWGAIEDGFVGEHYRLDFGRSGVILGEQAHVWDDLRDKAPRKPEVVIAMPKAARAYRGGEVTAIAESMSHARALARMHGVEYPIVCGG